MILRKKVMNIALFGRTLNPRHRDSIIRFFDILSSRQCHFVVYDLLYEELSSIVPDFCSRYSFEPGSRLYSSPEDMQDGISLFMALGGDGTILSSVRFVNGTDIPVAGINFGTLGFLTTAGKSLEDMEQWIDRLLSGNFEIDRRSILKLEPVSPGASFSGIYPYALNEISVQRLGAAMLRTTVKIDGTELPPYWSDGLLVSTPTGSTAYSLSVGGPVVMPSAKVLVVSPVAPHNLNVRPLVIPDTAELEIVCDGRNDKVQLTLDNSSCEIPKGTPIRILLSSSAINYVCLHRKGFFNALTEKLMWGEDRRNNTD